MIGRLAPLVVFSLVDTILIKTICKLKRVLHQQIFMKELAQPMARKELTEKMLNTELTLSTESTVLVPARLRMQLSARTDATPLQVNAQNAVAPTHEKER